MCRQTGINLIETVVSAGSWLRLLLVHGSLSHYRLARLIKYSFYKNILFCFVLFFFQFYCGFSGASAIA